ncbi:MAG: class F sortase [Arachnia sp.]
MTNLPVIGDRRRLIVLVAAVVVIVGLLSWFLLRPPMTTQVEPAPIATTSAPTPAASPSLSPTLSPSPSLVASIVPVSSAPPPPPPSPSPSPSPQGLCQAPTEAGFVPVRYEIERFNSDDKVVSLGLDKDGSIAAPPLDEPSMASWWNQGPRAGSDAGKVVLSIHTYRRGGAMGNRLFDGGRSALQPGDRIILRGADGQVACYDFVEAKKVAVTDYDPASNDMVDYDGKPLLTIIVCWDYVKGSKAWDSRVFFYGKPVVGD